MSHDVISLQTASCGKCPVELNYRMIPPGNASRHLITVVSWNLTTVVSTVCLQEVSHGIKSVVVHDCNRFSARIRFLQTGNTTESCSFRLAQAL